MEQRLQPNQLQSPQVHVIWQQLQQIPDPELPALSITDLGMIRNVVPNKQGWKVIFTPTYSGCPATEFLINEIKTVLGKAGFQNIDIEVMLTPA
ncbi:phenylacetic acid degradation protein, partial [Exiguobacterium mexicanum]